MRTHVDPVTGTLAYYTPQGRFVHVLPNTPVTDQVTVVETPWWMDPQYQIGLLSLNVRPIKLLNTLTQQEHELEVPGEETLNEILTRCARRLKLPLLVARFPRPRPRADRRALAAGTCRTIRTRLRTHGSSWGMCWT